MDSGPAHSPGRDADGDPSEMVFAPPARTGPRRRPGSGNASTGGVGSSFAGQGGTQGKARAGSEGSGGRGRQGKLAAGSTRSRGGPGLTRRAGRDCRYSRAPRLTVPQLPHHQEVAYTAHRPKGRAPPRLRHPLVAGAPLRGPARAGATPGDARPQSARPGCLPPSPP